MQEAVQIRDGRVMALFWARTMGALALNAATRARDADVFDSRGARSLGSGHRQRLHGTHLLEVP